MQLNSFKLKKNKWQKVIACLKQKDQQTLNVKAFLKKLYELAKIYQLMTKRHFAKCRNHKEFKL